MNGGKNRNKNRESTFEKQMMTLSNDITKDQPVRDIFPQHFSLTVVQFFVLVHDL